ncbi:heat shock protein transcriptional repressor HspR [Propionicicella superfundia]|uniref:heat shock protein transcriptional repressor HspR n=1 Tax=Propionicicella superfundia TaxID=348582 RepID=UPI0004187339|nr:MerR family transcriptional regulator [Propionicicella superfundia]
MTTLPAIIDRDAAVFTISVAARLADMHPQTLRGYDKLGLVVPRRARGRGRRYSARDVDRLRLVQRLSQGEGINLAGIRHILRLQAEVDDLTEQVESLADALRAARAVPAASRLFTADSGGDVRLGARSAPRRRLLALTR